MTLPLPIEKKKRKGHRISEETKEKIMQSLIKNQGYHRPQIKICKECGKEFKWVTSRTKGLYCSRQCADKNRKPLGSRVGSRVCALCKSQVSTIEKKKNGLIFQKYVAMLVPSQFHIQV